LSSCPGGVDPETLDLPLRGMRANEKYYGFVANAPRNDGLCKTLPREGRGTYKTFVTLWGAPGFLLSSREERIEVRRDF